MAQTPLIPVGKRIVVKPDAPEEKTRSGIILASSGAKEKPERGTVVAVGETLEGVKAGDTVVFAKYGYDEVKLGEATYYVVKHEDVVAVVK